MYLFARGGTILLLLGDFLTFALALLLTLLVRYQEIPSEAVVGEHLTPFLYVFFIWILVFLISGLYDRHISLVRKSIPILVLKVQFINILIAALFFFIFPFGIAPKTNLVIYLVISTVLIVVWRLYVFPLFITAKSTKALIIGDGEETLSIARVFATNPFFKNIQAFHLGREGNESFEEFREGVLRFIQDERAEMIIADMRDEYIARLTQDFYTLAFEDRDVRFFNLPMIYEHLLHRVPPALIEENWLLENIASGSPHYAYEFLKRSIDIVGALILLVPTAIVFPFIALAIKLEDKGVLFYQTERVGRYNSTIKILKFRTKNGTDSESEALHSDLVDTRVGLFLRKTRLDELPQLINVLKGDLSFIGPRPEIPTLAHVYAENIPYYNMRHHMKPGLSGWAQINNFDVPRGGVDISRTIDKLSFDIYYLKRRSLLLDIEIALKTINTLVLRSGT